MLNSNSSSRNDGNTHVGSSFSESELAADYRNEGYVSHYNRIDAEVTAEDNCEKCGHIMRYIGLKKEDREEFSGQSQVSYIAISHCDNCGNEYEF